MNIGILASGGDGAGMNNCLYELAKNLKGHKLTFFGYGYRGLIEGITIKLKLKDLENVKDLGGVIIKSSRCKEFLTSNGQDVAVEELKARRISTLIILGGNGSLKGAKELIKRGINVIFIPTTIDNDIMASDYSLGYDTAIRHATEFVMSVDISMQAFDRICIYEVMGRHCPDLAFNVGLLSHAGYVYTASSTKEEMYKALQEQIQSGENYNPCVILQENVTDIEDLKIYLQTKLFGRDIKTSIIGYYQRGGLTSEIDMNFSTIFALKAVECIKNNVKNVMTIFKDENIECFSIEN